MQPGHSSNSLPGPYPRLKPLAVAGALALMVSTVGAAPAAWAASQAEVPAMAVQEEAAAAAPGRSLRQELREVLTAARDQVFPALVNIDVLQVGYYGGDEVKGRSVGSGTILSAEGHVLTNYHVTAGGSEFTCTLADQRKLPAKLVGEDPLTDLAVLKLDLKNFQGTLPVAQLGDSDQLQVGDYVLAMGSPFALSRSVTLGIVSNVERVFAGGLFGGDDWQDFELSRGVRTGLFTRWIQHDALINPGNSGGPLVDLTGKVVGVNELGGSSIGFAIPSNLAQEVAALLIAQGEVPRSWIGASFRTLDEEDENSGVRVASLEADGPAARSGLEVGDILREVQGEPIHLRYTEEIPLLMKRFADLPAGSVVEVAVLRGEEEKVFPITTEKLNRDRGQEMAFRAWGFSGQQITPKLAGDRNLSPGGGVFISGVRAASPAQLAEPPLEVGDVLRALDGEPVAGLDNLLTRYEATTAPDAQARELLVELDRGGQSLLTLLKSKADEDQDLPRELPKAWLGVATQPLLRPVAEKAGFGPVQGFRISRVYGDSEAAKAGLRVGDVILAVNGDPLVPRGMQDVGLLVRRIQQLTIGKTARLAVLRDGEEQALPVVLEKSRLTPQEARRDRDRDFELVVREVTFFDRDEQRWDDEVRGVLVDSVEPAGWAGLGGVRAGDLIQRLGEVSVRGIKSYREALHGVSRSRSEQVIVVVRRGRRTLFFALKPNWSPGDPS